ncbi:hypothetical protein M9Y10_038992 [Tritrichomonas musculus]|uniref:F5/8 type C domain-containing protein n=1 Tax=Tritrichomonas musculus TaxID=1915356 RepID=A0ABR2K9Y1_9EUKA
MNAKSLTLSSAGLKNILQNQSQQEEFRFLFGEHEIKMGNLFAEFISPYVSQIHQSDPTINFVQFSNQQQSKNQINSKFIKDISNESYSLFDALSKGNSIIINKEKSYQLQIISILLQNEELFKLLNDLFYDSTNDDEDDTAINQNIEFLSFFQNNSKFLDYSNSIKYIASHLYSIDKSQIIKLPINVFYSIIKNDELKIESEDSLLELIESFFSEPRYVNDEKEKEVKLSEIDFCEELRFEFLTEEKFKEFIDKFDVNEMTADLWRKLKKCFYFNKNLPNENCESSRYFIKGSLFKYDGKSEHAFDGIIRELTKKNSGNVDEKGVVKVTSSSVCCNLYPKRAVDFDNIDNYFASDDKENSWLQYDFINLRVRPTHYSMRSRNSGGKGYKNPMSWLIEGSNDAENWTTLDSQKNVTYLDGKSLVHTFDIKALQKVNFFRYLRIRQTSKNSGNDDLLVISALEYFGSIIQSI